MKGSFTATRVSVVNYCESIGRDTLLVQGAGGNVSWKDGETLWIKASGTCLAHAKEHEIFLPVDLCSLRNSIADEDFTVIPTVLGSSILQPSIETLLHALMPQPVVVHLHAIEILAHLVRVNWLTEIQMKVGDAAAWASVSYKRPGPDLAKLVSKALRAPHSPDVVFLQNHGVVIGGNSVFEVDAILKSLTELLRTSPSEYGHDCVPALDVGAGYIPVSDSDLHNLAKIPALFERLDSQWALYPDHVVFLGACAQTFSDIESLNKLYATTENLPDLIFLKGEGVFVQPGFNAAKQAQLRCYYDVLVRQPQNQAMNTLGAREIGELLNWDAEQYRMRLSKVR